MMSILSQLIGCILDLILVTADLYSLIISKSEEMKGDQELWEKGSIGYEAHKS